MAELLHQRYQILKKLGSGGTGEVWEAQDLRLKRKVAIKRIRETGRRRLSAHSRLLKEAEFLAMVDHPNVVMVHDILEAGSAVSIVMELVRGTPFVRLFRKRALPEAEYIGYFRQLVAALEAVHDVGIIHRDINPRNVVISNSGVVKLMDFGLSGLVRGKHRRGGTLAYMAPECLRKNGRLGFGVDIYSLGFMSYQAVLSLSGFKKLYGPTKPEDWIRWVLSRDAFRTLKQLEAPVSDEFSAIIARMLEKNPAERYQRVAQVKKDLEALLEKSYPSLAGIAGEVELPTRESGGIFSAFSKVKSLLRSVDDRRTESDSEDDEEEPAESPDDWSRLNAGIEGRKN